MLVMNANDLKGGRKKKMQVQKKKAQLELQMPPRFPFRT